MKFMKISPPFPHWTHRKTPPFKLNFIVKCILIWKMRNSFSLPKHTYIYLYLDVKIWTVASHFVNACHVFNVKENKSFISYSKHTSLYQFFLNGGGYNTKNSKNKNDNNIQLGKLNNNKRIFPTNVNLIFKHTPCDSLKHFPNLSPSHTGFSS